MKNEVGCESESPNRMIRDQIGSTAYGKNSDLGNCNQASDASKLTLKQRLEREREALLWRVRKLETILEKITPEVENAFETNQLLMELGIHNSY